ncbi:MAG TPA: hypothetical protein VEC38_04230 [Candidatus Binataceae bacterium]|nr:hypothetical protein [Candidatus Binataceae bacterium]
MTGRGAIDFEFNVTATSDLEDGTRSRVLALFRDSYNAANEAYLERSLTQLRFIATVSSAGALAGFALGEMRIMDLPRLPRQAVALAGICCIDARSRRRGLFVELERRAFMASGIAFGPRVLHCGRVAHPASFRTMTVNPTHVPKPHTRPTPWQQQVGEAIAKAYGAAGFDPETFVCAGSGTPVGYPRIDIDVRPDEWQVFAPVNRDRGDSLLGLCWLPDAPEGW